jgi:hypothetical protein
MELAQMDASVHGDAVAKCLGGRERSAVEEVLAKAPEAARRARLMERASDLARVVKVEESDDEEAEPPISPILPSARAEKLDPGLLELDAMGNWCQSILDGANLGDDKDEEDTRITRRRANSTNQAKDLLGEYCHPKQRVLPFSTERESAAEPLGEEVVDCRVVGDCRVRAAQGMSQPTSPRAPLSSLLSATSSACHPVVHRAMSACRRLLC